MKKRCYFEHFDGPGWPTPEQLAPYFFGGRLPPWTFESRNDSWGLEVFGLYGTESLPEEERVNVHLYISGRPDAGITLDYRKWDGRIKKVDYFYSEGDLSKRELFINTAHGDLLCWALFVPFDAGWRAVKEFIETDGELPKAISWISSRDLPQDMIVDMGDRQRIKELKAEGRIR